VEHVPRRFDVACRGHLRSSHAPPGNTSISVSQCSTGRQGDLQAHTARNGSYSQVRFIRLARHSTSYREVITHAFWIDPGGDGAAARSRAAEGPKGTGAGQKRARRSLTCSESQWTTRRRRPGRPTTSTTRSASPVSSHHFRSLPRTGTLDRSSQPDRPAGRPARSHHVKPTRHARHGQVTAQPATVRQGLAGLCCTTRTAGRCG